MARYEFSEGTSNKFWEIELAGRSFTTTYGKIGSAGQTTLKEFESEADAKREHDKLVAEKVRKGYVLVGGKAAKALTKAAPAKATPAKSASVEAKGGVTADARNPDLERAILVNPYDTDAYSVYADWLQEQGDPRGELIPLQLTGDKKLAKAAAKLLEQHAGYFLGPLAEHPKTYDHREDAAFTWRFGYIHAARLSHINHANSFKGSLAEVFELLLRHPSARFLTELSFGFNGYSRIDDLTALIEILIKRPPPALRVLHFGDFEYPDEAEMSWYTIGKLGKLWKTVPQLQKLIVQGGSFDLGTAIDLPELRDAAFRTGGLDRNNAKVIAKANWPQLEQLEIWFGEENYGGNTTVADLAPLLARTDLPKLRRLGLMNSAFTDELCEELPRSKLLAGLAELDLSMGCMTDPGAQALAANAAAFRHLDVLDVSENYLTKRGVASLAKLAKQVVSRRQRKDDDPEYRYPAVGE